MTQPQRFHTPPVNMVQAVRNIIEGYSMGAMRALGQDPPQNSYDAAAGGPVVVDYRLHRRTLQSGEEIHILTVTDRNTTGLRGPAISLEDLHERAHFQLAPDENWAAWEAMGYTKVGEHSLGSRGQGKAAFLYHSRHDTEVTGPDGRPLERMVMAYDSLLADGTYRLGLRIARPDDVVLHPPYEGDAAREIISTELSNWGGPPIPLGLQPLTEAGTRIIVPMLTEEAVDAFVSGELGRWLERSWWRAIQKGELAITIGEEGGTVQTLTPPSWWRGELWEAASDSMLVKEDIWIDAERRIKRLVLLHDDALTTDEIANWPEQYEGVQLLRGNQWIETLGAASDLGDFIPPDKRVGFRGFVEFDTRTERDLREIETPQHDAFRRQKLFVRQIRAKIQDAVREFAELQGWREPEGGEQSEDQTAQEILERIADLFVAEAAPDVVGPRPAPAWVCELYLEYPTDGTTRVNWGERLRHVIASCAHTPDEERRRVRLEIHLISPDGKKQLLGRQDKRTRDGRADHELGDLTVVQSGATATDIRCAEPGRYQLRAECVFEGRVVASAHRNFFVECDPPVVSGRPVSVDLQVENATTTAIRINSGDAINVAATVSSRMDADALVDVTVSIEDLLLADEERIKLQARPAGDVPTATTLTYQGVRVFTSEPDPAPTEAYVVLPPGRHFARADIRNEQGDVVAHASRPLYVEVDPDEGSGRLPFELRPHEAFSIWELHPPAPGATKWMLKYARNHPTYRAAVAADEHDAAGVGLYNRPRFFEDVVCSGLVEWALATYREQGDEGGFELLPRQSYQDRGPLWERYRAKVQDLVDSFDDPLECLRLQREVVSMMIHLLREAA